MGGQEGSGRRSRERPSVVDTVAGWVLFAVVTFIALLLTGLAAMLPFGLDACETCDDRRVLVGWAVALLGPWPPLIAALVLMVVRSGAGRSISWIPLAALGAGCALSALGWGIAFAGE